MEAKAKTDKYMSAAQIAKKHGLSRDYVLKCCKGPYGNRFARPSSVDKYGRCNGKWMVNEQKFLEIQDKGWLLAE